jgi:TolA-binding protein
MGTIDRENGRNISVYRTGLISIISIIFVLVSFLSLWGETQREEEASYIKQIEKKLDTLDNEINELKDKGIELKDDTKAEFNKEMAELRKKQKEAKEQLNELRHTATKQWGKAKSAMDGAARDLKSAFDNLFSRFKGRKIDN